MPNEKVGTETKQTALHTPGPWRVCVNGDNEAEGKVYLIGDDSLFFCRIPRDVREPEFRNNALLIAAAPEMLEALKFVKEFFRKMEDHDLPGDPLIELRRKFHAPVHAKLDAAINRAERGETR